MPMPTPVDHGEPESRDGLLLTRHWRDRPDGVEITLWAASDAGPLRAVLRAVEPVCFVEREARFGLPLPEGAWRRRRVHLRSLAGRPVDGLYFRRQADLEMARGLLAGAGVILHESDLRPPERFLMERFVTAGARFLGPGRPRGRHTELLDPRIRPAPCRPSLRAACLDIETSDLDGELYSIGVTGGGDARVFLVADRPVPAPEDGALECLPDERAVIEAFLAWVERTDPDLLLGWNVVGFDLDFLERRCRRLGLPFTLGRGAERAAVLPSRGPGGMRTARIPGRVALDGIEWLRAAFWSFESYDLETVAQALLGRGKRIHGGGDRAAEVRRLYREDPTRLAAYNLGDCRLTEAIFERADLVRFAMRRAELTGLALDRTGGSVAAFDHLYLPRLHRRGWVAPDAAAVVARRGSPGGHVLESRPGLYDNVLVLDFKSLYPSIIRTFRIDPLGLAAPGPDPVEGFDGGRFAREGAILPALIEELWAVRDEARREGDRPLAQAVKILMNSFYGVLGATGCRFRDPRLASSITRRGHEIIERSRERIEAGGREVIYGDTDSLFVLLGPGPGREEAQRIGRGIAEDLNTWWRERLAAEHRLESCLEVELETHFLRFFMPTVRGESTGSKKRYAGLVRDDHGHPDLVIKGLESVRTDWTPLARRFQRELLRRVFLGEPWEDYVRATLEALLAGRLDEELVYRKRLIRPLESYLQSAPPHVQAARKLPRAERSVRYLVTPNGPEPLVDGTAPPRPDHAHYRDRQLAPAADGILHCLGTSFEALTSRQLDFFPAAGDAARTYR